MTTPFLCYTVRGALLLAGINLLLLSSCKQVCEQNLPAYRLGAAQLSWGAPYVADSVWRFRNAAGYERRYRITSVSTDLVGKGSSKSSLCNTYNIQQFTASLGRTDSTQPANFKTGKCQLFMEAVLPGSSANSSGNSNSFTWNGYGFYLPVDEVAAGQYPLTTATFGRRTYPNVITSVNGYAVPPRTLRVYFTLANGVVAFDDQYGTRWARQ